MLFLGRIQVRNYDDENGTKHFITEVVAEEAYFADSKKDFGQMVKDLNSPTPVATSNMSESPSNDTQEITQDDDLPF